MWEVVESDKGDVKYDLGENPVGGPWEAYTLKSAHNMELQQLRDAVHAAKENGFTDRLAKELGSPGVSIELRFYGKEMWHYAGSAFYN